MITRKELIKKYIEFFKSKGHSEIPNVSLVPENDPTVLFTTAGMHPLVPFLLGQPHPQGKRLVNVQRCIRTGDIEEVGDTSHHTFFEMMGNWSIGDYFKKEAIEWSFEFLTKELKIPIEKIAISVFGGDHREPSVPKDKESKKIWSSLGIPEKRISSLRGGIYESKNNWWGPAGNTGPCGPDTEMFYWKSNKPVPENFNPEDENWLEIWNDVLMQYVKDSKKKYNLAKQKNVDTGIGLERTLAILNGYDDNYLTEIWQPIIKKIEKLSKKPYNGNEKEMRIIADHIKASVFIISDGVTPSNTERGYVLRRLIRRAIRYGRILNIENFTTKIAEPIFDIYKDYNKLKENKEKILEKLEKEEKQFMKRIEEGMRKFEKIAKDKKEINSKTAFLLFQSFGFPLEIIKELAKEKNIKVDEKGFQEELTKHQELSRTASAGTFKAGLADNSEQTTKLHTATHLLLKALQIILKDDSIIQKGSNITPERLRLDFNFPRKITKEELNEVEKLVNMQIKKSQGVIRDEMPLSKAKELGTQATFGEKYGEKVSVYSIGDFSKEICSGPHVKNTSEIGNFKIKKEESSSAGVRRIKAILE